MNSTLLIKGEATPERISELENIFEINRDNGKIRQMKQDVADYERTVKAKAALDEKTDCDNLKCRTLMARLSC